MIMLYPTIRRAVEVLLVLFALPIVLPMGVLLALVVVMDSNGGAFFVQIRPGKHGKPFRMLKFRSMTTAPQDTFRLTEAQDTRLTRAGRWMRAAHLDEIPQLWHVFRGEMSLVGPRPVPMELYADFLAQIPEYDARHAVAPGITGLAQINLGYVNTLEGEREKWLYDVYYIKNQSAMLDLRILMATLLKLTGVRTGKGRATIPMEGPLAP